MNEVIYLTPKAIESCVSYSCNWVSFIAMGFIFYVAFKLLDGLN